MSNESLKRFPFDKLHVYFHVALMNSWRSVLWELLYDIEHSGLAKEAASINVCFAGGSLCDSDREECARCNATIIDLQCTVKEFEFPTLEKLFLHAQAEPSGKFLYIHTKGVSAPTDAHKAHWRREMAEFVIWQWKRRVNDLYDIVTSGPRFTKGGAGSGRDECPAVGHYSGNFWWARGSYISKLPNPMQLAKYNNRFWAEAWLGSRSEINREPCE